MVKHLQKHWYVDIDACILIYYKNRYLFYSLSEREHNI